MFDVSESIASDEAIRIPLAGRDSTSPGARLVVVAGNIGSGKTSLARLIGTRLNWHPDFESVQGNPYMSKYYEEPARWAFHLQMYCLNDRAQRYAEASRGHASVIFDRSLYEDYYVFARTQHRMGLVSDQDLSTYRSLFDRILGTLPVPTLLIYLKAPVEVLKERIARRGREIETGISTEYLSLLESHYDEWLKTFDVCQTLTIDTDQINFVNDADALEAVSERIRSLLPWSGS
jgi:deoxyadenosine/deoxycytidine kinase